MEYFATGSPDMTITAARAAALFERMLDQLGALRRVLLVPPDYTRLHSGAGELTVMLYKQLAQRGVTVEVLPALGTHAAMSASQLDEMFPGVPRDIIRTHRWRDDLHDLGEVPAEFVRQVSEGAVSYPIACQVNRRLVTGQWDRIISIGQLVPHEVVGIASHSKNVFVGVGGQETINKTHFLGAAFGMERIMGRPASPVRAVLGYMASRLARDLPISYVLTVRGYDSSGRLVTRGLYGGDDEACFQRGARLCQRVNLDLLDAPLRKVVVYLDEREFQSTWLGNKAIYRLRMAMVDAGELIILAPGVRTFSEDPEIDRLIRRYGYRGARQTLENVEHEPELAANLSAAAHLIHGSTEGRFTVTYCPGGLSLAETEAVGFAYAPLNNMLARYDRRRLTEGMNRMPDGEEVFFVSNPAAGLWALRSQFEEPS